jgi:catechol 2,3-dioxygenase-like lactoylglutathione lyase family enzyme
MSLDAIGIVTADCEKAIHFYKLLGIEFVRAGGHEHFEAKTSSGVRLLLDSVALIKTFEPDFVKVRGTGVSLCFKQESPKKVVRAKGSIQSGLAPVRAGGRHAASIIS